MKLENKSTAAVITSVVIEKIQLIVGIMMALVFGITAIMSMLDFKGGAGLIIALYILTALGLMLIYLSRKQHNLIARFNEYIPHLLVDPTGSIQELALGTGIPQEKVIEDLKVIIRKKYLINTCLDLEKNRIIFLNNLGQKEETVTNNRSKKTVGIEYKAVTCKSCGAVNKVQKGVLSQCEYCGIHIEAK